MNKKSLLIKSAGVISGLVLSANVSALTITLGDQDFNDGDIVGGVAAFEAPQAGEPAPFGNFIGTDIGSTNFSASWSFNYAAQSISAANLTFGIFDHDAQAPGLQVDSFMIDGFDFTSDLNTLFESSGGAQTEYNIFSLSLTGGVLAAMSDGLANISLSLDGPSLVAGGTRNKNGAALDFATLELKGNSVSAPEPSSIALLGLGLAGLGFSRKKKTS